MKLRKENKYYSLDKILSKDCDYNLIIGERSNGKTYALLEYSIKQFYTKGEQTALLRRWKEDIRGKRADTLYSAFNDGRVKELTNGEYTEIYYYNGRYYLSNYDSERGEHCPNPTPMAFTFALSEMEHDKSTSYPEITTIVFDEFITRRYYLPDEFVLFLNVLSTIIRQRQNVKIFMLGNTVNKYCPYYKEMGLKHISNMEQGTIDVYKLGGGQLTIAVE